MLKTSSQIPHRGLRAATSSQQDGILIALATGRAYRKRIPFDVDNLM